MPGVVTGGVGGPSASVRHESWTATVLGVGTRNDDERALLAGLTKGRAKREEFWRAVERRHPELKARRLANTVDMDAARRSMRKAAVDAEVEKRLAAQGDGRLLRIAEVMQLVGLKRTTLWKMEREGKFPARVRVGERAVRWRESEVLRGAAEREAARST